MFNLSSFYLFIYLLLLLLLLFLNVSALLTIFSIFIYFLESALLTILFIYLFFYILDILEMHLFIVSSSLKPRAKAHCGCLWIILLLLLD